MNPRRTHKIKWPIQKNVRSTKLILEKSYFINQKNYMREDMEYPESLNNTIPGTLHFYPDQATLLLDIDNKFIDQESKKNEAEQLGLMRKNDFHLTIIGNDTGKKILTLTASLNEKERENILDKIYTLAESIQWKVRLEDAFFYIQKEYITPDQSSPDANNNEKRESIIQTAGFEGIDEFYQKFNIVLGTEFETPWPHITHYTTSTREDKKTRGIGIYSQKQFEELHPQTI